VAVAVNEPVNENEAGKLRGASPQGPAWGSRPSSRFRVAAGGGTPAALGAPRSGGADRGADSVLAGHRPRGPGEWVRKQRARVAAVTRARAQVQAQSCSTSVGEASGTPPPALEQHAASMLFQHDAGCEGAG
jgi:hypothetical protein